MAMRRTRKRKLYGDVDIYLSQQMKSRAFRRAWAQTEAQMALAKELIRLRAESGLTQAQVAEMVKTTQSCLSRLERRPPLRATPLLKRVAAAYGRDVRVELRLMPAAAGKARGA